MTEPKETPADKAKREAAEREEAQRLAKEKAAQELHQKEMEAKAAAQKKAEEAAAKQKADEEDAVAKQIAADKAERERLERENPELMAASAKAAEQIMKSDEGANTDNKEVIQDMAGNMSAALSAGTGTTSSDGSHAHQPAPEKPPHWNEEAAKEAYDLLRNLALSYPRTTPDQHVVVGFGGIIFRLEHLRALFGISR